jgi:beta-galactosidase
MAHGAELVSYFRWRQFPQAQEQHHAGLLRPDSEPAPGLAEAAQAARDIAALGPVGALPKSVALVFAYDADWVTGIQPQGAGLSALWAAFDCYSALRELGLDIDIVPPGTALDGYALVVIPCLPIVPEHLVDELKRFPGQIVIGPRTGSRTVDFAIPEGLAPGDLFPAKVTRVESLRPGLQHGGEGWAIARWLEHLETAAEPELVAADGTVASWQHGNRRYLGAWPDRALALTLLGRAAADAGLATHRLPEGLRLRRAGSCLFAFNYAAHTVDLPASVVGTALLGGPRLEPGGVAVLAEE